MAGEFTPDDLARLNATIARTPRKVQQGNKMVENHSMQDLLALRDRMITELDTANGPRVLTTRATFGGRR